MPNLAQITIAGHIGRDAELRYTQGGDAVASFSVAVNNRDETTTWYRCSIWRKYAEVLTPLLTKGKVVTVIGDFAPRQYEAKDGTMQWSFDIQASNVIVAGDGGRDGTPQSTPDNMEDIPF